MIKFFRRIRLDLIQNNITGKYLKYAIGEIMLVVIGILIALQINNWNENQKDLHDLDQNLKTIISNLESDILNINQELLDGNFTIKYWQSLLENKDNDSLAGLYIKNITLRFIPMDNAGFTSIVANNNLDLISDINLKSSITSYYGIDFINKDRYTEYLSDLAKELTTLAIEESIKVSNENTFEKRMSVVIKNPAFSEMTKSYMRLYQIILSKLEERKLEAKQLISNIKPE